MKKFFLFAVLAIWMVVAAAQITTFDTIPVSDVTNRPTLNDQVVNITKNDQVVNITKGDTVILTGVDSVVTVKTDTVTKSEFVKVYVDSKVVLMDWVKPGYTSSLDTADTTGVKKIYQVVGGDEDGTMEAGFPLGLFIVSIVSVLSFFGWLWWKVS